MIVILQLVHKAYKQTYTSMQANSGEYFVSEKKVSTICHFKKILPNIFFDSDHEK